MSTSNAKDVAQKINETNMAWARFLAEVHRLVNDVETSAALQSVISSLAIPSRSQTKEQQIQWAVSMLNQIQNQSRTAVQKLRSFLTSF